MIGTQTFSASVLQCTICTVMMCKALPKAVTIFQGAQRQTAITSTTFQLMNEGTNDSDANLSKMD